MNDLNFDEFIDFYDHRVEIGLRDWAIKTYGSAFVLMSEFGWYISGKSKLPNKQMQQWYVDNWLILFPEDIRHDYDKIMQAIKSNVKLLAF